MPANGRGSQSRPRRQADSTRRIARRHRRATAQAVERGRELLKRFGLEGNEGKYPAQLSGGMRQRVAIAQQFMCSDDLLLMDEPFFGLDPLAITRMIEFIQEVASQDETKTIVIVTHDITAAIEVSDTIWMLGRDRDAAHVEPATATPTATLTPTPK
ncbi:ATP-binding cassette domain-containing protein, partial [bacterium]